MDALVTTTTNSANVSAAATGAIDIIVPVYRRAELTIRCLQSLARYIHEISDRDPRLIIINDSPDDEEVRRLLASFSDGRKDVTVITNDSNQGFVKAVNKGLAVACTDGRDAILVNSDTETFPDALKNIVAAAAADPQIGFVSPRSNNASICSLPHFCEDAQPDQEESYRRWKWLSRQLPAFHFVPTANGFYLYIRHSVIANFGLLDPEFGIGYEEENDLILRANKVGYRAVLANNAFVYHAGSASFGLLDLNLAAQKDANLQKMARRHEEFLPLIRRYEESAHFHAERLLQHALPSASGKRTLLVDLSSVGPDHNGTNEMSVAIIDAMYERHSSRFEISVLCSESAFLYHKLDQHRGIKRYEPHEQPPERFAIGVRLSQPFTAAAVNLLSELAVVNVFGMLDTIADDCGYLSITYRLDAIWDHVARHASGLFFNSRFSERQFLARFPQGQALPRYARLLPTKVSSYKKPATVQPAEHVLIVGNHFAHKASDLTAEILRRAFPTIRFAVLGKENAVSGNVEFYRAGTLDEALVESLYLRAGVVVLPSYVEGFGFGLLHALAAGKVVVARDIPATREILATYKGRNGIFLYANDCHLVATLAIAIKERGSWVDDAATESWSDWVDGFADFCIERLDDIDLFDRLLGRLRSVGLLRKVGLLECLQSANASRREDAAKSAQQLVPTQGGPLEDDQGRKWTPMPNVNKLLALDGEAFVYASYVTILKRLPDSGGLLNYLKELQCGIGKLEVISRLKNSREGQRVGIPLAGYRSIMLRKRLMSLLRGASG
jgi:GT2 family glycosyltransferase